MWGVEPITILVVLLWEYHTAPWLNWNEPQVSVFKKSKDSSRVWKKLSSAFSPNIHNSLANQPQVWKKCKCKNNLSYWPFSLLLWPDQVSIRKRSLLCSRKAVSSFEVAHKQHMLPTIVGTLEANLTLRLWNRCWEKKRLYQLWKYDWIHQHRKCLQFSFKVWINLFIGEKVNHSSPHSHLRFHVMLLLLAENVNEKRMNY